jgi:hypothetical protein
MIAAREKVNGRNGNFETHTLLAKEHENLMWKKEAEERKAKKKEQEEKDDTEINEKLSKSEDHAKFKVHKVMKEFKEGKLHSGSKEGKQVTDRKQAIAIAMSEAGLSKSKEYDEAEYQKHKHHFKDDEDVIEKAANIDYSKWTAEDHQKAMKQHQEKAYNYKKESKRDKAYEHEQAALQHKGMMQQKMKESPEKGMIQKSEAFDILISKDLENKLK